jgi:hypothetical protein
MWKRTAIPTHFLSCSVTTSLQKALFLEKGLMTLTLDIPDPTLHRAEAVANAKGKTLQQVVEELIEELAENADNYPPIVCRLRQLTHELSQSPSHDHKADYAASRDNTYSWNE